LYSKVDQIEIPLPKGEGTLSTVLDPLQLFPGTYYVVATLKDKSETTTFDLAYSDWFNVEGDMIGYEDLDAIYEPNRKWEHQVGGSSGSVAFLSPRVKTQAMAPSTQPLRDNP
jgi:hypothetical protein